MHSSSLSFAWLVASLVLASGLASPVAVAAPAGSGKATGDAGRVDPLPPHAPSRVLPSPANAANTCAACHATLSDVKLRAPAKECAGSAHRDDRLSCVGCHGGDPRDPTAGAHSKALAFMPHPTHAAVASLCGSCHSDAALMRRLNGRLQIGQEELFKLSLHGRLASANDTDAPNCAVCHGRHDIISPSAPSSPVNRQNVAKLCSGCHADANRMAKYDVRTDQFDKWQKSVHGRAFAEGNPNAPTCTGCHGAHGSAPPDSSSVAHACGRCHETEMQLFERSVHSSSFRKRGIAQCVVCHDNHDIAPASPLLVGTTPESTCMKCHDKDDRPREVAAAIGALLGGAHSRASAARAAVTAAHDRGLTVAGVRPVIDRLSTAEGQLRGIVHTLDRRRVETAVDDVDLAISEAQRLVTDAEHERSRELRDYCIALAFATALLATLVLKARQLSRRRRDSAA